MFFFWNWDGVEKISPIPNLSGPSSLTLGVNKMKKDVGALGDHLKAASPDFQMSPLCCWETAELSEDREQAIWGIWVAASWEI